MREALAEAILTQTWVVVSLRGDPARGVPVRQFEGRPLGFVPLKDGRERVVLEIVEGATEQILLLDRIVRVSFRTPT